MGDHFLVIQPFSSYPAHMGTGLTRIRCRQIGEKQSRIHGNGGQPGRFGVAERLDPGVLLRGGAGLRHVVQIVPTGNRFQSILPKEGRQLCQLTGIAGADDDLHTVSSCFMD